MSDTQTMVEILLTEGDKLGMGKAGEWIGSNQGGPSVHATTVTRWCLRGVRLAGGARIRLEHFRCGGKLLTTKAAIVRFLAAQTENPGNLPNPRTPTERTRAAALSAAELESFGI
jgi:hypothetical protein